MLGKRAALALAHGARVLSDAHDLAASNNKFDKWPDCIAGNGGNGSVSARTSGSQPITASGPMVGCASDVTEKQATAAAAAVSVCRPLAVWIQISLIIDIFVASNSPTDKRLPDLVSEQWALGNSSCQ